MTGKTDGKPVNRARRAGPPDVEEPWLGSYWSLAVFIAAELAIGSIAVRLATPAPPPAVTASAASVPFPVQPVAGSRVPATPLEQVVQWAVAGDAGGRPFVVVDKPGAHVMAFDARGQLMQSVPALLGSAIGDDTVPGVGDKPLSQILPEERITPAGRFVAQMGENLTGEDVVWVDYDAAVSMHRIRKVKESERRFERLASDTVADNRISNGCINLPVAFYEQVLRPLVEAGPTVVYVLPEQRSLHEVFARHAGQASQPQAPQAEAPQAPRQPVL
ncbi:hypothetical protein [Piscinibacter sp. HJYY11]|uniref:hypothetical protein n=1 Tax=Piscinibacter sp. HJYY11 TaxID=2801333 RepID=UPI00191CD8D8|nr:hypothetical protein [Piscinibacter sp. HJYY11]MBL0726361.1 hypothetical protein [Piscinibacter sp. HJYY11]